VRQLETFNSGIRSDFVAASLSCALSAGLALSGFSAASLVILVLAGLLATLLASNISGLISLSSVFFAASLLYAVSGPLAVLAGTGLPDIFGADIAIEEFLFHASLGLLFTLLGYGLASRNASSRTSLIGSGLVYPDRTLYQALLAGGVVGVVAFAMQLANYSRIGGLAALAEGKAYVQSELSELVGDLPAEPLVYTATFFSGLGFALASQCRLPQVVRIALLCSLSGPLFAALSYLYIGRRIELVGIGLAFLCGRYFVKPSPTINLRAAVLFLCAYLSLTALYGVRDILPDSVQTGDYSEIQERLGSGSYWGDIINPGANEFGAPLGNYSAYLRNPHNEYLLGRSYLEGLSIPIPRLIWPEKPVSVIYQFRDDCFPAEKERGAIAGTAFSSILEAYMNFGVTGIVVVYLLLGYWFGAFDVVAGRSTYWLPRLAQALLMPFAFTLPRSSFEAPYFVPLIGISATGLALLFVRNAGQRS